MNKFLLGMALSIILSFYGHSQDVVINEIMSSNTETLMDSDGDYVDWIELYNKSNTPFDLTDCYLSDEEDETDKWQFPSITLPPQGYLIIFASGKDWDSGSEIHTNFKLSYDGEPLFFFNSNEDLIDDFPAVDLDEDESFGRSIDGVDDLGFLSNPTPGQSNNSFQFNTLIQFSESSGYFNAPFDLTLEGSDTIYYTLDGSIPTNNSQQYSNPIHISANQPNNISLIPTSHILYNPNFYPNNERGFREPEGNIEKVVIVQAVCFKNGMPSSETYSQTYFTTKKNYTFPVISLITDSLNLFDENDGIYIPGNHLDSTNIDWTGNYFKRGIDWERPANIEYFNIFGELEFSEKIGFRISGQKSRSAPQKSLRLYFRSDYGKSKIDYPFFPMRSNTKYKRLILRSTYTYWWKRNTLFQDDLMQSLAAQNNLNMDYQLTAPSVLFINGEYWGIHNIRERQDKYYLNYTHSTHVDSVDIIEGNMFVIEGSANDFIEILDFIDVNDISTSANYEYITDRIDIENYITYFIFETFFDNQDWPGNNVKIWKSQTPGSKWRWLLYDLDAALNDYTRNPFGIISASNHKQAKLFNALMTNDQFKLAFLENYFNHLETTFSSNNTLNIVDQFQDKYSVEVEEHIRRWHTPNNYNDWLNHCNHIRDFMKYRSCHMKDILVDEFEINETHDFPCLHKELENDITLFPNPTSGKITFSIANLDDHIAQIEVYNNLGQVIKKQQTIDQLFHIDLSEFNNGVYYIRISYDGRTEMKKVVLNKN